MKLSFALALCLAVTAAATRSAEAQPDAQADAGEHWPTPFSAEEIRDAWPPGFQLTLRVATPEGEREQVMRVVEWSPTEVTIAEQTLDVLGDPIGAETISSSSWLGLRDHARFPRATTTRIRERRDTPLGELEGWLYTRQEEGGTSSFFFADGFPGPPVEF